MYNIYKMENLTELISNIFISKNLDKKIRGTKETGSQLKSVKSNNSHLKSNKMDNKNNNSKKISLSTSSNNTSNAPSSNTPSSSTTSSNATSLSTPSSNAPSSNDPSSNAPSSNTSSSNAPSSNASLINSKKVSDNVVSHASDKANASDNVSDNVSANVSDNASDNVSANVSDNVSAKASAKAVRHDIKKFVLNASNICNKNILIVNHDVKKNFEILSNILYKLGKLDKIYEKNVYVFTFNENKKDYRDILIENPYLYFTNFKIKNNLSDYNIDKSNLSDSNKKHIVIVDYDLVSNVDELSKFMKENIQLIVLYNTYTSEIVNVYNYLGKSAILINKKDRLKLLQNRFYSKIIKHIYPIDDYSEIINDEYIKMIIIKNNQLRVS